ncbi:MAG: oligosaccharide flippase family protein [Planctomycetes bacterium]|nr:oligosaccharide flippase family protein [Planctomycetota bacterium]
MEQSLSRKVFRNTVYNLIGQFWGMLVMLGLTPYIINRIGVERFGVWAIVGVLTGYFGLLDFGIRSSFIKYISEYYARKEDDKINQVVNTGFVFYLIFGIVITGAAFLLIGPLLGIFKIPQELAGEARLVLMLGMISMALVNVSAVFESVPMGLQRMDISSKVSVAVSFPNIIGTILFLEMGYGLAGLMLNRIIIVLLGGLVNFIISFRVLPSFRFGFLMSKGDMFKRLITFGYKIQLASIYSMITLSVDKLLIGYFLPIGLVTFYQLGNCLTGTVKGIVTLPASVLLPAFSEVDGRGEREKLIEGYKRTSKYLSLIALPFFTFVIVSASQIMMVWMGEGYEDSVRIAQLLAIGHLASVLAGGIGNQLLRGIGHPEVEMHAGLINVLINLPLSVFFIIKFGLLGAALGTMASWFIASFYYFRRMHQIIHLPMGYFIKTTFLKTTMLCLVLGMPLWFLPALSNQLSIESARITAGVVLIIQAVLFWGGYFIALCYIKPLDKMDVLLLFQNRLPWLEKVMAKFSVS